MKRYLRWAARLYPRAWRERYEAEFDALLDDVRPSWRDAGDILLGAAKVHLTKGDSFLRFAAFMGAAGLLLGAAASLTAPKRYVSTGVVRVESEQGAEDRFQQVLTEVLSRSSLAEVIQRPPLDLYREDRRREPMEAVIEGMRTRDIRIAPRVDGTVEISFAYPDPKKADATVRALMNQIARATETVGRQRAQIWQTVWPNDPAPGLQRVVLVSEPSAPQRTSGSASSRFLVFGGAAGLVAAWLTWRPKRHFKLAGFALAGATAVLAVSFAIGDRYTSTAVVRIRPADAPPRMLSVLAPTPPAEQFQLLANDVLGPQTLSDMIAAQHLLLYRKELKGMLMPEVVQMMRDRDLRITPVGANAFRIEFTYPDRYKAQRVVRELITQFAERFVSEQRARAVRAGGQVELADEWRAGPQLEVLDPATLPERPIFPNRLAIGGLGLPIGLFAGIYLQRRKRAAQPA
jgi:hypothetical protein